MMLRDLDSGEYFLLHYPGKTIIGRAKECDIRPQSLSVSKKHAQIDITTATSKNPSIITITNLNARNGTFIGDGQNWLSVTGTEVIQLGEFIKFGQSPKCYVVEPISNLDLHSSSELELRNSQSLEFAKSNLQSADHHYSLMAMQETSPQKDKHSFTDPTYQIGTSSTNNMDDDYNDCVSDLNSDLNDDLSSKFMIADSHLSQQEKLEVEQARLDYAEAIRLSNKALSGVIEYDKWKQLSSALPPNSHGTINNNNTSLHNATTVKEPTIYDHLIARLSTDVHLINALIKENIVSTTRTVLDNTRTLLKSLLSQDKMNLAEGVKGVSPSDRHHHQNNINDCYGKGIISSSVRITRDEILAREQSKIRPVTQDMQYRNRSKSPHGNEYDTIFNKELFLSTIEKCIIYLKDVTAVPCILIMDKIIDDFCKLYCAKDSNSTTYTPIHRVTDDISGILSHLYGLRCVNNTFSNKNEDTSMSSEQLFRVNSKTMSEHVLPVINSIIQLFSDVESAIASNRKGASLPLSSSLSSLEGMQAKMIRDGELSLRVVDNALALDHHNTIDHNHITDDSYEDKFPKQFTQLVNGKSQFQLKKDDEELKNQSHQNSNTLPPPKYTEKSIDVNPPLEVQYKQVESQLSTTPLKIANRNISELIDLNNGIQKSNRDINVLLNRKLAVMKLVSLSHVL
jgi:hypothetical protein